MRTLKIVTVPKLADFFRSIQKLGITAHYLRFFAAHFLKMLLFRIEVGETIRHREALTHLKRSNYMSRHNWLYN